MSLKELPKQANDKTLLNVAVVLGCIKRLIDDISK